MNITEVIWRNSHAWPDRLALISDGKQLSYKALRGLVVLVSARLHDAGLRRGDCVALAMPDPVGHLVAALAAARIGLTTVALTSRNSESVRETLVKRHRVAALVSGRGSNWHSSSLAPECHLEFRKLAAPADASNKPTTPPMARDADDEPWLITVVAGAGAQSRSSAQTHWRAVLNASLPTRPDGTTHPSRLLVFSDLSLGMSMSEVLRQLYAGGTLVLTQSTSAENFFDVVERDQVTHAIMTSATAADLLSFATKSLPDSASSCRSLKLIAIAGGSIPRAMQEGIMQRICPRMEVRYGWAETGFIASASSAMLASHPASVGRIAPWVQAQAVDEHDKPVSAGQVGILRFKTPAAACAYLENEEATARNFRDGWFYPGGKGAIDAAGYLRLV